nr:YdiK family protein [Bacillus massilionigeriensis]
MRKSPLLSGLLYVFLGLLFTTFAIQNVQEDGGWGIFTYLLIVLATFDLGSGIKMVSFHFKLKKVQSKK